MASLKKRGSIFHIQYYCGAKQIRVSTGTDCLQIAKEKLRQFESAQMRGDHIALPTKTSLPEIVQAYAEHMRAVKNSKERPDRYLLFAWCFWSRVFGIGSKQPQAFRKGKKTTLIGGPRWETAISCD
jgi:hypothetical protein